MGVDPSELVLVSRRPGECGTGPNAQAGDVTATLRLDDIAGRKASPRVLQVQSERSTQKNGYSDKGDEEVEDHEQGCGNREKAGKVFSQRGENGTYH
jgi:hypothetical protein